MDRALTVCEGSKLWSFAVRQKFKLVEGLAFPRHDIPLSGMLEDSSQNFDKASGQMARNLFL